MANVAVAVRRSQARLVPKLATMLLFPHGSPHVIGCREDSRGLDFDEFIQTRPPQSEFRTRPSTRIMYGHYVVREADRNPLRGHLSSFLHLRRTDHPQLSACDALVRIIEAEQQTERAGWQAIASQLTQVVFHQALRMFVSAHQSQDGNSPSHAQLVTDPAIGLVVGLLHAQLEKPWTVISLARWVGMSRSAFSERFRVATGKPPLQYLTEVRMARACYLLRQSDLGIKQIAATVGYESPSSFTNAFKRWNRVSPASFRAGNTPKPCCG